MFRIASGVEYDGSDFCGWQIQKEGRSVQAAIEKAIGRVANHDVATVCAGRTDAGVHASAQVIHFDTASVRTDRSWLLGCNSELPGDVNLSWVRQVPADFHARFSARSRRYRYLLLNRQTRSALCRSRAWVIYQKLDVAAMRAAARLLLGEHDFTSLRAAGCQAKSPVRTIFSLDIAEQGQWISIDVCANAFLQHMVRNIAGVLVRVGLGEEAPGWTADVLAGRDRKLAATTAPAAGLYFYSVDYPAHFGLPDEMANRRGLDLLPGRQGEVGV